MTGQAVTIKRAGGVCEECGFVNVVDGAQRTMRCGGCGQRVRLTYVQATYNGQQPCDDRCQYAVSALCSCSCGGRNHRAGYIEVDLVPVWVRDRDRKRHQEKRQRAEAKAQAQRQARQEKAAARRAELLGRLPVLARLDDPAYAQHRSLFLAAMHDAWLRGIMTDRQAEAAARALGDEQRRQDEQRQREERARAAKARGEKLRGGRTTVTCRIVKVRDVESPFGYRRREWKMTVETTQGWRLYGTLPAALMPERGSCDWDAQLRGRVVTLAVTIKPKDGEDAFGYFSRPTVVNADAQWPEAPTVAYDASDPDLVPAPEPEPVPVGAGGGGRTDTGAPERAPTRYPWGKLINSARITDPKIIDQGSDLGI